MASWWRSKERQWRISDKRNINNKNNKTWHQTFEHLKPDTNTATMCGLFSVINNKNEEDEEKNVCYQLRVSSSHYAESESWSTFTDLQQHLLTRDHHTAWWVWGGWKDNWFIPSLLKNVQYFHHIPLPLFAEGPVRVVYFRVHKDRYQMSKATKTPAIAKVAYDTLDELN